jgi:hypothetical protein
MAAMSALIPTRRSASNSGAIRGPAVRAAVRAAGCNRAIAAEETKISASRLEYLSQPSFVRYRSRTGANTMSASTRIAVAVVTVLIAPALGSAEAFLRTSPRAESQGQWTGHAMSGAYAAANKTRRATRSAPRGRVSQATDPSAHIISPDGRDVGTDPDAAIRFQLKRDSSMGGM